MGALIYDSAQQAFVESDIPKIYSSGDSAFVDTGRKVWNSSDGAWKDAWGWKLDPWKFYIQPSNDPITFPYTLVRDGIQYYVYMPVVDFSKYKGKVVKMSFTNHSGGNVVLKAEANTTVSQSSSGSSGTLSINLTGVSGSGTIKTGIDYSVSARFTITNIWLT